MYRRIFLLLCFSIFVKVQGQQFTDITNQSGIDHYFEVYEGMFGGGIAVLDYNNDGFEDLYITGGMQEDQLLENLQNGTFKNVLKTARLESVLRFVTQGVAAADFNRDGWMDLFVTTITTKSQKRKIPRAQNLIFINQGDGTFKNNSKSFGIQRIESYRSG